MAAKGPRHCCNASAAMHDGVEPGQKLASEGTAALCLPLPCCCHQEPAPASMSHCWASALAALHLPKLIVVTSSEAIAAVLMWSDVAVTEGPMHLPLLDLSC